MPQDAINVDNVGVYSLASSEEQAMALISVYSDPSFQGIDISVLSQSMISSLLTSSFANTEFRSPACSLPR